MVKYKAEASLPLAKVVKQNYPEGFEPLNVGENLLEVPVEAGHQTAISTEIDHPSTEGHIRQYWCTLRRLWIPKAWCKEVDNA